MFFYIIHYLPQNLKKGDIIGKTDPYVLVNLLGGNVKECKTKVVKNNANPVWEESIRFMANEAQGKVLLLQIFDKDMLKDDPIGEVVIINSINQIGMKSWTELQSKASQYPSECFWLVTTSLQPCGTSIRNFLSDII